VRLKSILVPVEDAPYRESVLGAAITLGRIADSYIEGCPVGNTYLDPIAVGPMGGAVIRPMSDRDTASPEELCDLFTGFMARNEVSRVASPESRLCFGWSGDTLLSDMDFASRSRIFDVVVAGRPDADGFSPRVGTLECALFEGGRPVLVVPPTSADRLGRNVVIAWNCSNEAARTVSFAMGLLESAENVCVLTVEGGTVAGPSGAELCGTLAAHGISAEERTVEAGGLSTGAAILHHAQLQDADLIVKGAYTHSRMRQMIFGGATSHLIYNADLPVLMAS